MGKLIKKTTDEILSMIRAGIHNERMICEKMEYHRDTVRRYLKSMNEAGMIYVFDYEYGKRARRTAVKMWAIGNRKNKTPPKAETSTERMRRRTKEMLENAPMDYEALKARKRHQFHMKKFKPRPDIAAAWLFGKAE